MVWICLYAVSQTIKALSGDGLEERGGGGGRGVEGTGSEMKRNEMEENGIE